MTINDPASRLRQRAEAIAREKAAQSSGDLAALSLEETRRMLHELQVHQIELELQNEELREAQAAMEASQARYFDLYDLAPVGYCTLSEKGLILEANLNIATRLGVTRRELVKQPISWFIFKDDQHIYYRHREQIFKTGEPQSCELRMVGKDGTILWTRLDATAVQDTNGEPVCRVVLIDISEGKRNQAALMEAEWKFQALFEKGPIGVAYHAMIYDALGKPIDYRFLDANESYRELTGVDPRGKTVTQAFPGIENDPSDWIGTFAHVARTGESIRFEQYLQSNGRWYDCVSYQYKPDHFVAAFMEITERKRVEEALRRNEAKQSKMVANIGDVIVIIDQAGINRYKSPNIEKWFGWRPEEVVGESALGNVHPEDVDAAQKFIGRLLAAPDAVGTTECRYRCKDGGYKWIEFTGVNLLHDPDIRGLLGNYQDITERKRAQAEKAKLEAQFHQAQKMESVGQLAGGVAHDFNNILAAIMMQLGFLRGNPNLDAETQELLKEVMVEAKQAASLTRQLLIFSRRSILEVKVLDLNEVVANLLKMLSRLIGDHIAMRFERHQGTPTVEADAGMMEQVVMNLALNARDAMPHGGTITISIESVEIDAERAHGHLELQPGQFVCLSVADTGCGMDEATLKHIFEPFFTTKEPGKGTGLGLATVHGIAAQHKGWVEMASELGQGTTFKVFLPATTKGTAETTSTGTTAVIRGHETILLVEDEAILRRMVTLIMRRLGYQVLEAINGREAMVLWQEHGLQIDLLLTDMVMPEGMTGLDLVEKLRAEKPNLKVIISSGYNAEMAGQGRPAAGGITYLQKPYEVEGLSKTIRDCLDRA